MKRLTRTHLNALLISLTLISSIYFTSCSSENNPIIQIFTNEVTAKQRLDSADAQAKRKYGQNTQLVLIFGKNVKSNGKTDISTLTAITSPDSIGAWLYVFKDQNDTAFHVYTPNPLPGASDCIELTEFFNINTIAELIQDTSAQNIISGALSFIINSNVNITTNLDSLLDSDASLNLANTTNPVIRFNSSYIPDSSSENGNAFFSTGTNKTINMFLVPAAGTLNLPHYITTLLGFPPDLWIVNYRKIDSGNENLVLGTVVQSSQIMGINLTGLQSKVINLSKDAQ